MTTTRLRMLAVLWAAIFLAAAACSSSNEGSSDTTTTAVSESTEDTSAPDESTPDDAASNFDAAAIVAQMKSYDPDGVITDEQWTCIEENLKPGVEEIWVDPANVAAGGFEDATNVDLLRSVAVDDCGATVLIGGNPTDRKVVPG